ncbi:uncharacterized protein GLRG_02830 [Colletotrichum graminicola M1.001]|uniref:Uncharacterized protein n=1 Tax=Colletotrichum graminicola (strain M1.001 / M2 / FGSC 10212) TaxID=645133 RepID=E3Q9Z8_COLGM|nr:uncharacterized protein GLRG_02830 [Colletotrichum graminicola M1.001]EFQ27686.1 hypothetical protein GLRG_02830 [Colletotrichum graminicola M1.001]
MSSPTPVPSKAAIHALRGLLFGTSCSLVLLAEERRQRIKLARSAVENGRRLKSIKRYSSSGVAALEVLQEEAATDPNFIGCSRCTATNESGKRTDCLKNFPRTISNIKSTRAIRFQCREEMQQ